MSFNVRDNALKVTKALPAGASAVQTDGIDLQNSATGQFLANVELLISAPALVVGELADASTITYTIEDDHDSAFGSVRTLITGAIVQTGAGGAGAAAATYRFRLPTDAQRYVRVKATKTGAASAAAKSVTVELLA